LREGRHSQRKSEQKAADPPDRLPNRQKRTRNRKASPASLSQPQDIGEKPVIGIFAVESREFRTST